MVFFGKKGKGWNDYGDGLRVHRFCKPDCEVLRVRSMHWGAQDFKGGGQL